MDCLAVASTVTDVTSEDKGPKTGGEDEAPQHAPGLIDVGDWCSRATLDIIGLSGMGKFARTENHHICIDYCSSTGQDFNSLANPSNKLNNTYKTIFNPGRAGRVLQVAAMFVPFWLLKRLPLKRNQDLNNATDYIKQVCRDMIAKKRERFEKGQVSEVDILSVALNSGGFKDEELGM